VIATEDAFASFVGLILMSVFWIVAMYAAFFLVLGRLAGRTKVGQKGKEAIKAAGIAAGKQAGLAILRRVISR
jgi:hypothetical protein